MAIKNRYRITEIGYGAMAAKLKNTRIELNLIDSINSVNSVIFELTFTYKYSSDDNFDLILDKEDESTDSEEYMVDGIINAWRPGKKIPYYEHRQNMVDREMADVLYERETVMVPTPRNHNTPQSSLSIESDMTFITDTTVVTGPQLKKKKTFFRRFKSICSWILRKTCCCIYK